MVLILRWIIGFLVSLLIGHYATRKFRDLRNKHIRNVSKNREAIDRQNEQSLNSDILTIVTGLIERTFFTLIVAFDVSGGAVAMMGWLGAKMAVNWNRQPGDSPINRAFSMTALQAGIVSLLFSLIGGLICKW
ncbi:MAG: hypothetical protein JRE64_20810 [Deltaproteobacteria bacterium]|nr:hypothetical protein [Deltaproteobacteria bacterium]